ncbi:MAG: purine-nucleoside phosphorylase [Arcobacter sp.]|nr:MAG: purine-nucleoside phosphorylase [Arcobacter sp.]
MQKENLLISSCLYGKYVRYDGDHNKIDNTVLNRLKEKYTLFPFCPEVEGGLSTPRVPCEIISYDPLQIRDKNGKDQTKSFLKGAKKTLHLCQKHNITKAILKSNSPSCSSEFIYDGSFSGVKIARMGVTAQLLKENGIDIFDEYKIEKLL